MPYFPLGFEVIAKKAEDLKVTPVVGALVDTEYDLVDGKGLCGSATYTCGNAARIRLRLRQMRQLLMFERIDPGENPATEGTQIRRHKGLFCMVY